MAERARKKAARLRLALEFVMRVVVVVREKGFQRVRSRIFRARHLGLLYEFRVYTLMQDTRVWRKSTAALLRTVWWSTIRNVPRDNLVMLYGYGEWGRKEGWERLLSRMFMPGAWHAKCWLRDWGWNFEEMPASVLFVRVTWGSGWSFLGEKGRWRFIISWRVYCRRWFHIFLLRPMQVCF